jgi:hypothetical protein
VHSQEEREEKELHIKAVLHCEAKTEDLEIKMPQEHPEGQNISRKMGSKIYLKSLHFNSRIRFAIPIVNRPPN